jgi:nucleotide-binding universal stress UspA family protein
MRAKILLALDGSDSSTKAAQYVANLFANRTDVTINLFHVLSPIPPAMLEGGLQTTDELHHQRTVWLKDEAQVECNLFAPTREIFEKAGFPTKQIQSKCLPSVNQPDVAYEILKECEQGDYDTVVVGKRGSSSIGKYLTGTVTERVVRHSSARAVWVIE